MKHTVSPIPRLFVPADIYDEALAFCNRRLAEAGLPQCDALPAGVPLNLRRCPCAQSVPGLCVAGIAWWIHGGNKRGDGPSRFTAYFDKHAEEYVLTLPVRDPAA